jgi:hypothetical protein
MDDTDLDQIIMAISATGAPLRGSNVEIRKSLRAAVGGGWMTFTGNVPARLPERKKARAIDSSGRRVG